MGTKTDKDVTILCRLWRLQVERQMLQIMIAENKMQTTVVYQGYTEIMGNDIETII